MNQHSAQPIRSVVVLTGAGVSAESGIKTFRASDGLWENHPIEEVATPEGFARNPSLVYQFYNARRAQLLSDAITPNAAHTALAKFEYDFIEQTGGEFLLVTQNVDNLHERAGSRNVLHMHGELLKMRCSNTEMVYDCRTAIGFDDECRCCQQPGNLRPHIVWFGEMPFYMQQITEALLNCDLFISIGTSGNVYPAAGFYQTAKQHDALTVELNLEPTGSQFDEHHYGPASELVPQFLTEILAANATA